MIAVACITVFVAVAAADLAWRGRHEADLRRRWRSRHRQPWRTT
jgi:hypothetical protein